ARHQPLDALVDISQSLFEADHGFPTGGEAEMARLDDSGVDGTDGDFVQAFALHRQELVWTDFPGRPHRAQRMTYAPSSMVEPWSRFGRSQRFQTEQVADGRFEMQRRRMAAGDRRERAVRAIEAHDADLGRGRMTERHVNFRAVAPKPQQRPARVAQQVD